MFIIFVFAILICFLTLIWLTRFLIVGLIRALKDLKRFRKLTVFNIINGKTMFEITGKGRINIDKIDDGIIDVTVKNKSGKFESYFIRLNKHIDYRIEEV